MNDRPLPLDVARSLVHRFGESALDVARNRAATAERTGEMKDHDHALMILTEVEELLLGCDMDARPTGGSMPGMGSRIQGGKKVATALHDMA